MVDDGENLELDAINEALIRGWKGTKDPIVLEKDFIAKVVMIWGNVGFEDVKASAENQAD